MSDLIPSPDHDAYTDTEAPAPNGRARRSGPGTIMLVVAMAFLLGLAISPFAPAPRPVASPAGTVAVDLAPDTLIDKPVVATDNVTITFHERVDQKGGLLEDKPPTITYRGDATVKTFCTAFEQLDAGDSTSWGPNYISLESSCSLAQQQVSTDAAACEQTLMGMAHGTGLDLGTDSFDFVTTRALDTACDDSNLAAAINAGAADVPVFTVSQGKGDLWAGDRPIMK